MRYKLLYCCFVVAILLYGSFYMGPFTPRQLLSIIMLVVCAKNHCLIFDKVVKAYLVFVVLFIISSAMDGYLGDAISFSIGNYLICYAAYCATSLLYSKERNINLLYYTIIGIGLFNALVTLTQFMHINVFESLLASLRLDIGSSNLLDNSKYNLSGEDSFLFSIPGIFPSAVTNGYFSAVAVIASLILSTKQKKIFAFMPWGILLLGCFATMQRTAFFGSVVLSFAFLYKYIKVNSKQSQFFSNIIIFIIVIIGIIVFQNFLVGSESRYNNVLDMSSRANTYDKARSFMFDNMMFGGIYRFLENEGVHPHNLLYNAIIVSGIFGAICIAVILYEHISITCKFYFQKIYSYQCLEILLPGLIIISLVGDSIFHNISIVYGDVEYWLFAGYFSNYLSVKKTIFV